MTASTPKATKAALGLPHEPAWLCYTKRRNVTQMDRMAGSALKLMSVEEFPVWQQSQEDRYELVDGVPTLMSLDPITMMTGASSQHDRITGNVFYWLYHQFNRSLCWPAAADLALRAEIRSLRRADVRVTCDETSLKTYEAKNPKMVVEVLPPSNKGIAWQRQN